MLRTIGTTMRLKRAALVAVLALAAGASSCGGVTDSRVAARNRASKAACDRAQACGNVGPGQTYNDYMSCITIVNGDIDANIWPPAECQQIDQAMLNVCLSAINGTQCGNLLNFLVTLGTCGKQYVCVGPAGDAGGG
jgi:hypothetical protein